MDTDFRTVERNWKLSGAYVDWKAYEAAAKASGLTPEPYKGCVTRDLAIDAGNAWGAPTFYHLTERNADGTAMRVRVTGKCKVWKRKQGFRLPIKYGLKTCGYITEDNNNLWLTYDPTVEKGNA